MAAPAGKSQIIDSGINAIRPSLERLVDALSIDYEEELHKERQAHVAEIASLKTELFELQNRLTEAQTQLQAANEKMEVRGAENAKLQEELDAANQKNVSLSEEMDAANRLVISTLKDGDRYRKKFERAERQVFLLKEQGKAVAGMMKKAASLLKEDTDHQDALSIAASSSGSVHRRTSTKRRASVHGRAYSH